MVDVPEHDPSGRSFGIDFSICSSYLEPLLLVVTYGVPFKGIFRLPDAFKPILPTFWPIFLLPFTQLKLHCVFNINEKPWVTKFSGPSRQGLKQVVPARM